MEKIQNELDTMKSSTKKDGLKSWSTLGLLENRMSNLFCNERTFPFLDLGFKIIFQV